MSGSSERGSVAESCRVNVVIPLRYREERRLVSSPGPGNMKDEPRRARARVVPDMVDRLSCIEIADCGLSLKA